MRRYETFVIVDPDLSQDQREQVIQRVEDLITQMDGFLVFTDNWGERKLAYDIKKRSRGYYVRFDYCGLSPLVNEIERFFRIDDRALKYMTILLDKAIDFDKVKEEKAEAESKAAIEEAPKEESRTVEAAPAADTPVADTPAADTPATDTPATDTPAADTPATDTPAADTPAADTPAAETPAGDTPAEDTVAAEEKKP
ncbi:MAG: 30S ribosomal protein S6, partial [Deltaproteobacteria bacterium]|nr:30S ribosomal protein S6 [Deltaproteobacteria bacterium]